MYDLWNDNNKCPPEVMQTVSITSLLLADLDGNGSVDFLDLAIFALYYGNDCVAPHSCGSANLDGINGIDLSDLAVFVDFWLWGK